MGLILICYRVPVILDYLKIKDPGAMIRNSVFIPLELYLGQESLDPLLGSGDTGFLQSWRLGSHGMDVRMHTRLCVCLKV